MTQLIANGGTATQQDQYTGPAREVSVDDSNHNLRLHDGATPGGHIILSQDNADDRYQAANTELDGFEGLEAQERGFWVRLGPGDYRLRVLTVNVDNLTITFGNGHDGNPLIALASTIESEHTWNGQQLFNEIVQFNAGINADVNGSLFGDSAGVHTGPVIGDVEGDADGNHTGSMTGDVDVRGATLQLDDGQIPTSKIAGLQAYVALNGFPVGGIAIWSGDSTDVPAGWNLCDGTNGTFDLSDKFIVGAGDGSSTFDAHDTGGTSTHNHTVTIDNSVAHTHGITVDAHTLTEAEMPAHKHGNGVTDSGTDMFNHGTFTAVPTTADSIDNNANDGIIEGWTTTVGDGDAHSHTASSAAGGVHSHTNSVDSVSHLPPYYALCFIQKMAP